MRIGVYLPQREPGMGTDTGVIRDFAQAAESMGYDHIRIGDHVLGANPGSRPGWRGLYDHTQVWHEPLVLLSYLAAITQTLELVTSILILPQRQTVLVAKQAATLDFLSGGRVRLGIGVGWNDVEYEALGEDFNNRGRRCEEQIQVLRALWTKELVTFEGRWHKITDAGLNPMPIQRPIPIWFGGGPGTAGSVSAAGSDRVLRRIARIGDGWFPVVGLENDVGTIISRLHEYIRQEGRDTSEVGIDAEITIAGGTPDEWVRQVLRWKEAGATHVSVQTGEAGFDSPDQHIDTLRRFKDAAMDI